MKRTALLLLYFVINLLPIFAQNSPSFKVLGKIEEATTHQPLQQATVRILTLSDSTLIKGTVSGQHGDFSISITKSGTYLLSVSFIGFETYYKNITLTPDKFAINVGTISVVESSLMLKEAVVQGKAPEVVLKEDTVEYNADSYKLTANSVVEDLVKKLPGVEIDEDGNVKAGGKVISKILVDGKEFFGKDVKVALKNINVAILDKLQVIDQKSEEAQLTGVDDGEEVKVINLTIKKGMKTGWFGNARASYGNKDRYEGMGMVNRFVDDNQYSFLGGMNNTNNAGFSDMGSSMYSGSGFGSNSSGGQNRSSNVGANFNVGNKNIFQVGGNVFFAASDLDLQRKTLRENILTSKSTFYDQDYISTRHSRNLNADLQIRGRIDSLTRFEISPSFQYNNTRSNNNSTYHTQNVDSTFINRGTDFRNIHQDGMNYSLRATISRGFKNKKGRKVSASFAFSGNKNDGTSFQNSHTLYGDEQIANTTVRDTTIRQRATENSDKQNYRIRFTYVEPFATGRFLQLAYSFSRNLSNSDRLTYNWDFQNEDYFSNFDSIYSDKFKNVFLTQNINVNIRTVRKKYNYTVGLNVDPSTTKSYNLFDEDRSFKRSLVNLGPTAEFIYLWNKHHNLRIQYRGRTQQPSINQLQPSKNITNPLNIRTGNLDLKPSYISNYSLRYSKYIPDKQRSLQAMIQGQLVSNSIVNQTTYNEETGVQTTKPINVNGVWNINGMFMFNSPILHRKFQFSNDLNANYRQQIGFINGTRNVSKNYGASDHLSLRYVSDLFDLGVRGNYYFSRAENSVASKKDQTVMKYGGTGTLLIYLSPTFTLSSDFTYSANSGYASSLARTEMIWNAQTNFQFLKNKRGTLFVRAYDLLHQRSTLSRRVSANYIEDVETNLLTDYFLAGFSYRFNSMGGKAQKKAGKAQSQSKTHSYNPSF